MHIEFGFGLDGVSWRGKDTALGSVRTGPRGLLSILETRCGVVTKSADHTIRVAGMYTLLGRMDNADAWFHDSFTMDPWATAEELLAIADELRQAQIAHTVLGKGRSENENNGRKPTHRITGMTRIAAEAGEVAGGVPDRFATVIKELRQPEHRRFADVTDLRVDVDLPYDYLSPIWQATFECLVARGGTVRYADSEIHARAFPEATILRTADEWEAAEYVAARLQASLGEVNDPDSVQTGSTLGLLIEEDATVLDHTLDRHGLPVTGAAVSSSARWELQLLPAYISTFWTPADPQAIAEFLSVASGVVRKDVADAILQALQEHPGVGGPKWQDAIERIRTGAGESQAELIDRYFSRELFEEDAGIPLSALLERIKWLRMGLAVRLGLSDLAAPAIAQTEQLELSLAHIFLGDDERVSRTFLERVVRSVVLPVTLGNQECAAPWRVYRDLGSVRADTGVLLWWNCIDPGDSRKTRFTTEEIKVLADLGFAIEDTTRPRRRHRYRARRFLAGSADSLLLVLPARLRGEPVEPHPLVEEIDSLIPQGVTKLDTGSLPVSSSILGSTIDVELVEKEVNISPPVTVYVSPGSIDYPRRLSYSAIRSLLGCPMQWSLSNQARLGRTYGVALPTGNQMLGTLTHKIVELLVTEHPGETGLTEDSAPLTEELFDRLVPAMAAELALPGKHLLRRRYRATVVRAVTSLGDAIEDLGLSVRQVEQFLEAAWKLSVGNADLEIKLVGPADIELVDDQGAPFVLDLKFSYARDRYEQAVQRGEAIQLATYAWLIEQQRGIRPIGTGYFLLPIRRLITSSDIAGARAVDSVRSTGEVWKGMERSVAAVLEALHQRGEVTITGLLENEDGFNAEARRDAAEAAGEVYQGPPCQFCDFSTICGLKRDAV